MKKDQLKYLLALQKLHGIGNRSIKNLIAYCGGAEAVFSKKKKELEKIPGIGSKAAELIKKWEHFEEEEKELEELDQKGVQILSCFDKDFPLKLKQLHDSPVLLYYKGHPPWNNDRVIAIVGTRKATEYGKKICRQIVDGLVPYQPVILSGLAYGIDICAHKAAMDAGLSTSAVVAHGLDQIYPPMHSKPAARITETGSLISEYPLNTEPEREHFPERNRIIAGLSDAVLVVESGRKGGATITANIAFSYNREVFAVPGNADVDQAKGTNYLIKTIKAAMVESAGDIAYQMGWDLLKPQKQRNNNPIKLDPKEEKVRKLLKEAVQMDGDSISAKLGCSSSEASSMLLNLEFKGVVKSLPGNQFKLA